jgi:hypothetical protein
MRPLLLLALVALASCGSGVSSPPPPPPCDEECKDGVAIRALREMAKLAFNVTLQGKPVGTHDQTTPCPMGGSARIFGTASSNATQGSTEVDLTYVFDQCGYVFKDDDPEDNYQMVLTGTLTQKGTLTVQPTATTAVIMKSDSMSFAGKVYDPPIDYVAICPVTLGQNGNALTGTICERVAGVDL